MGPANLREAVCDTNVAPMDRAVAARRDLANSSLNGLVGAVITEEVATSVEGGFGLVLLRNPFRASITEYDVVNRVKKKPPIMTANTLNNCW